MADYKPSQESGNTGSPSVVTASADAFTEVQEILTALFERYRAQTKRRRVSDNVFARWLGVSPSNWNYWINGARLPELKNALLLSPKIEELLGSDARERFMHVLGYPNYVEVNDSRLQYILTHWPDLKREEKEQLYGIVQQSQNPPAGGGAERRERGIGERGSGDSDFDG